jgi:RNA polymerase sigma factor (sigma-70 family)
VAAKKITHAKLDALLDSAAQDLESYDETVTALVEDFDRRGVALEISDPLEWRKEIVPHERRGNASIEEQFRLEVDSIEILDRENEARLARRIDFARRRLERAFEAHNIDPEVLGKGGSRGAEMHGDVAHECPFPKRVCKRWEELHALRKEMVERNLYLVLINVERYAHTRASRLDLIQEGASALFRAVDGFDWKRGLLFRTYAVHWLNQAFRSFLYNFGNTVRVPVYLQKAMKHVQDAIVRLGDPNATVERIAEEADLGENLVSAALEASRSTHSIDASFGGDDDGGSLREVIGGEDEGEPYDPAMEEVTLQDGVEMALDRLSDRERYVIERRFGLGTGREQTLAEIAGELGVSLERVRQIQVRAIAKMKTPKLRKAIDPFLL